MDSYDSYHTDYVIASTLFSKTDTEYIIREVIDLQGDSLLIPDGCTLRFHNRGSIRNGVIIGTNTTIFSKRKDKCLFYNIIIQGTWHVENIYSGWFVLEEGGNVTSQLKNMFSLCSATQLNNVFIKKGHYSLDGYDYQNDSPAVIRIPSHTRVYNEASFQILPTSSLQSFPFYFENVNNCLWDGGAITGDLYTHIGDKGEQGFGIALRGAQNITIKNVICNNCWGDGINLQFGGNERHNINIIIENVLCNNNRRQGISIEDGVNISIHNSFFSNTGLVRGTAPKCGIDIEPCYRGAAISGISISDCYFSNNVGGGISCIHLRPEDSGITIHNCVDNGGGLRFNDCNLSSHYEGISVIGYNCEGGKLRFKREVRNLRIQDCSFKSALNETEYEDSLSDIYFTNVSFSTSEKRTWNFYCISLLCAEITRVIFDDCLFEINEGSTLSAVFPSSGDWSGVLIVNSRIIDHRDNSLFIPCDVKSSYIETNNNLVFSNRKIDGSLLFENNDIIFRGTFDNSPFVFNQSKNQDYQIIDNKIHYSGVLDERLLIDPHSLSIMMPAVYLSGNSLIMN